MNPIINNLEVSFNSMKPLTFKWIAILKDCTEIKQFNEDGTENLFQKVKDRFSELVCFYITDNRNKTYIIDLTTGKISFNKLGSSVQEDIVNDKQNIRLIYFRRNQRLFSASCIELSHTVVHHFGYQYQDASGNNRKIILEIEDSAGTWKLGD